MRNALFAVLLFLLPLASANAPPPVLHLKVFYNGAPIQNDVSGYVVCFNDGSPGNISKEKLGCSGGTCEDNHYSPCIFEGEIAFEFTGASLGRNYTTARINNTGLSSKLLEIRLNPDGTSSISKAPPEPSPCPFGALALLLLAGIALRRE